MVEVASSAITWASVVELPATGLVDAAERSGSSFVAWNTIRRHDAFGKEALSVSTQEVTAATGAVQRLRATGGGRLWVLVGESGANYSVPTDGADAAAAAREAVHLAVSGAGEETAGDAPHRGVERPLVSSR